MIEAEIKSWGNSAGILIPKKILNELDVKIGDKVKIKMKKKNPLDEIRGKLKDFKPTTKSTIDEMLAEADENWSKYD